MMCPASRTLLGAAVAGMVVSSIYSNDTAGWIVAVVVGVVVHLVQRRRPELASCALPKERAQRAGTRPAVANAAQNTGPVHRTVDDGAGSRHISPER